MGGINFGWLAVWVPSPDWLCRILDLCDVRQALRSRKQRLTAVRTRCADHVTLLYPQKLELTSPTGGGRSVGIVRVRTKATELL